MEETKKRKVPESLVVRKEKKVKRKTAMPSSLVREIVDTEQSAGFFTRRKVQVVEKTRFKLSHHNKRSW